MDFLKSMQIAASGLRAQAGRMRIISENIANAELDAEFAGANPYRRKVPTFVSDVRPRARRPHRQHGQGAASTVPTSASNTNRVIRPPTPTATSNIPTSIRWSK